MLQDVSAPVAQQPSNVIAMHRHKIETRFPHIAEVEGYWDALRGRRALPRRSEVDPRGIERALERAFILEQIAPGVGRLRIAGAHLGDILGMEVRGMPLSALFTPATRDDLAACLDQVCATPCTITLSLVSGSGIGKPPLEARMILLPLRSEAGEINRILGCLDSSGVVGRAPRRFDIMARRVTRITGDDLPQTPDVRSEPSGSFATLRGFGESSAPFRKAPVHSLHPHGNSTFAMRSHHLRLVKTDITTDR